MTQSRLRSLSVSLSVCFPFCVKAVSFLFAGGGQAYLSLPPQMMSVPATRVRDIRGVLKRGRLGTLLLAWDTFPASSASEIAPTIEARSRRGGRRWRRFPKGVSRYRW